MLYTWYIKGNNTLTLSSGEDKSDRDMKAAPTLQQVIDLLTDKTK